MILFYALLFVGCAYGATKLPSFIVLWVLLGLAFGVRLIEQLTNFIRRKS